jgi:hypothetical protein
MKRISRKLTYSNVISTICLVLLVGGGTAYAASHLGKESVGTRQLKKEAVTPAKLSAASKAALTGPKGATGATGTQGPQGTPGAPGAAGATKVQVVVGPEGEGSFAHCPAGTVAVGGGGEATEEEFFLFTSEPLVGNTAATAGQTANGWFAKSESAAGAIGQTIAYALCASP